MTLEQMQQYYHETRRQMRALDPDDPAQDARWNELDERAVSLLRDIRRIDPAYRAERLRDLVDEHRGQC